MIDLKLLKDKPEIIKAELTARNIKLDFELLLSLNKARRELASEIDNLKAAWPKFKAKPHINELEKLRQIKANLAKKEKELKKVKQGFNKLYFQLPNIHDQSTPVSKDETGNIEIKKWGQPKEFDFQLKSHDQILEALDLVEIKQAAEVSGARFWYLKNDLVRLQFGLMMWLLDKLTKKGFTPLITPVLVKKPAMFGTGFFPAEKNEYYKVENQADDDNDNLYLVGTAEVALASLHGGQTIITPKLYVGYSSCFRKEAGTYGKDLAGIFRGHQFDKMEMLVFCSPSESSVWHEKLLSLNEEIWQELNVPYRVLNMCTGDIGAANAKKYDLEGWFPGQNKYRELVSCSNDTDFQARRLSVKFKTGGKKTYAHTLNTTAMAFGRSMACLLENYQQADGSVKIPAVLHKYCDVKEIRKD